MPGPKVRIPVEWSSATGESDPVEINGAEVIAFQPTANWTNANVSFKATHEDRAKPSGTLGTLKFKGAEVITSQVISLNDFCTFSPIETVGPTKVSVVSGVNQAANTRGDLIVRSFD